MNSAHLNEPSINLSKGSCEREDERLRVGTNLVRIGWLRERQVLPLSKHVLKIGLMHRIANRRRPIKRPCLILIR